MNCDSPHIRSKASGASLIQVNQLSTPALILLFVLLFLTALLSAVAIGFALSARDRAENAAIQAQLARNHADDARFQLQVLRDTLKIVGLKVPETEEPDE